MLDHERRGWEVGVLPSNGPERLKQPMDTLSVAEAML